MYTFVVGAYGLAVSDSLLPIRDANPPLVHMAYIYWISKIIELIDTAFIILRHKKRQLSTLHVFHHSSMLLLADYSYNISPWTPIILGLVINSFVHVVMYGYYIFSVFYAPKESSWWKRGITLLQMAQFLYGIVYSTNGYLNLGYCFYSVLYPAIMLTFFSNFYYNTYILGRKRNIKKE